MRILLSFNPDDVALAEAFRASLFVASRDLEIFFSPILFEDYQALELKRADALLLFVGPRGLTERQIGEYDAAVERSGRDSEFSIVAILAAGATPPLGLQQNLTWIGVPVVTDPHVLRQVAGILDQHHALSSRSATEVLVRHRQAG